MRKRINADRRWFLSVDLLEEETPSCFPSAHYGLHCAGRADVVVNNRLQICRSLAVWAGSLNGTRDGRSAAQPTPGVAVRSALNLAVTLWGVQPLLVRLLIIVSSWAVRARSPSTGTLTGTVTDPTVAVVAQPLVSHFRETRAAFS